MQGTGHAAVVLEGFMNRSCILFLNIIKQEKINIPG
jgi:hypothetical protein